jgi:hypothetical protein
MRAAEAAREMIKAAAAAARAPATIQKIHMAA